jgi:hypothetical protein
MTASLAARAERHAPLAAGIALALPVLVASYPPMADLPLHEAVVGVLRRYGDASYFPDELYRLNLGHPNQLWYYAAYLLSFPFSTAAACKLVVAAIIIAIPLGAARLADHLAVTRWTALVVAPLGLGWMFFWGLVANMAGLAALLAVLPTLDRYVKKPDPRGLAWSLSAMVLLYLAHEAMLVVACAMITFVALLLRWRLRDLAARGLPAAFGLAIAVAQVVYQKRLFTVVQSSVETIYYSLGYKLKTIPGVLFGGFENAIRTLMFVFALIPIALFAIERWRGRSRETAPWRERLYDWRFGILAVVLFACYLALPFTANSATLVHHRFLPPAFAILAVCVGAPRETPHPRLLPRVCAALVPIGSLLIAWPTFADSMQTFDDLETLIAKMDKGAAVAVAELGPLPRHRLFQPATFEGHVVAERGGRCLFDFTQSPITPAILDRRYVWEDTLVRLRAKSNEFRPKHDFKRFRYLLVHTTEPTWGTATTMVMDKEATFLGQRGEWYLFESKLERIALTDHDVALTAEERAATLDVRLKRFFDHWTKDHAEAP